VEKHQPQWKSMQLRQFLRAAESLYHELGSWAAAEYISTSIEQFKEYQRLHAETNWRPSGVKDYTMHMLCEIRWVKQPLPAMDLSCISPKCQGLLETLLRQAGPDFRGLIFVAQRATVNILKLLIENYPGTKNNFRCGSFVGMSNSRGRTNLGKCHDATLDQEETLTKFRTGALNLLITTNALEEGIDIPACNAVISFDRPSNIRSFIQRRGRARQPKSSFVIFVDGKQAEKKLRKEIENEEWLAKIYRDDERAVFHPIREAESYPYLHLQSTGYASFS
jgi:ERCC4-related helicase